MDAGLFVLKHCIDEVRVQRSVTVTVNTFGVFVVYQLLYLFLIV